MKKIVLLSFFILAAFAAIPSITFARPVFHSNRGETSVTSAGKGTVRVTPSGAYLDVFIISSAKSHKTAYNKLLKNVSEIKSHFKRLSYVKSMDTVYVNVNPNTVYKNGIWVKQGYNAEEDLTLKISGNRNVNASILFLLKHEYARVGSIYPYFINLKKYKAIAIRLACLNAINKTKAVLSLLKAKYFVIKKIIINYNAPEPFHAMMLKRGAKLSASSVRTPKVYFYKKGKVTERVSLEIVFKSRQMHAGMK